MSSTLTSDKIAAVARAIVEEAGADALTMRRVAAAIGITPMAIYRHYRDRDHLLEVVAERAFQDVAHAWLEGRGAHLDRSNVESSILAAIDELLDLALNRPHLYAFMFIDERPGARKFPHEFEAGQSPTLNILADLLTEGMRARQFRSDNVWELAITLAATMHGLLQLRHTGRISMSDPDFRALCHRAVGRIVDGLKE